MRSHRVWYIRRRGRGIKEKGEERTRLQGIKRGEREVERRFTGLLCEFIEGSFGEKGGYWREAKAVVGDQNLMLIKTY